MADLMQVSGLWKNTSANGEMYLQGKLGSNVRILIFKNKYKTADNQPDYILNFTPIERKEERPARGEEDDFLGAPGGANAQDADDDFTPGQRRESPQEKADREFRERPVARRPSDPPESEAERLAGGRVESPLLDVAPPPVNHYETVESAKARPPAPARPVDRLAGRTAGGTTSSTSPGPTPARAPQRRTTPEPPSEDFGEMEDPFAS